MAWVTTLGPSMDQIEYRLQADAGCSLSSPDAQVDYRLDADRPLEWVGDGLREVGIEPGSVLDEAGKTAARALANGRDPRTGEVLVAPKRAVDPRAKLPAAPLVDAVRAAAKAAGVTPERLLGDPRIVARYGRMLRGVARQQTRAEAGGPGRDAVAHRVPVKDLERVAAAAGVDLDGLYEPETLAVARRHRNATVVVGNRGYDLTMDLPKSYSVLVGLAPPALARELEDVYLDAVRETVTAMQGWAGYGMRGHHGDGQRAKRVDGTGLLGWMTVHRTARPVGGAAPDPHLHAHVTLLNLVRGTDGRWSTVGAGGRDIHRHAHAADALVKARLRQVTRQRWGIEWARDARTGAWEVTAVPARLRHALSKRNAAISHDVALRINAGEMGQDKVTTKRWKTAAADTREAKQAPGPGGDLRAAWHRQALAAGVDPARLVAAAMPGPGRPAPPVPTPGQVAAWVFRAEDGLTAHRKVTTRADVLAAVLDAVPGGVGALGEAEQLADAVLALDHAVALPPAGATHLSNADRYTSADVVHAERTVLAAARSRHAGGYARVGADALALAMSQYEAGAGHRLGAEQRAVLARLAGAGHGYDTVIGVAGAGKTTIMAALRSAYEASGQTVAGAATAAVAAQNLQAEAGIQSRTIASWLARIEAGPGLAGVDVLVVDEAAMVDDRHMARLLTAAGHSHTKVIGVGDPLQLKAVGVGGTFAAAHELMNGLELTDNRRQRDVDERAALAAWRAAQRRTALHTWADTGRVHVTGTPEQVHQAMAAAWDTARARWSDPHERIAGLLMLAHRNTDVDDLNQAARAIRVAAGELTGPTRAYRLSDGRTLTLGVGDQVLLRVNDRRRQGVDVLNGYRGIITALDDAGRVQIQWRRPGPDGPELVSAWVTADYVTGGGVSLGYAITAAKAQGLTADVALVYGNGMDAHVLYPAMSRDRERADLWLALQPLEDDADRARHGEAANPAEARQRAVAAYAAALERDRPDGLILTELGEQIDPLPAPTRSGPPAATEPARPQPAAGHVDWRHRPHGDVPGDRLPAEINRARAQATRLADTARRQADTAAQLAGQAAAGHGPAMQRLVEHRAQLQARVAAGQQIAHLRQLQAAAQEAARHAWQEVQRLDVERRRNPLALRLSGTSRTQIQARQDQLRQAARAAAEQATRHSGPIWDLQRQAGGHGGATRAATELAGLHQDWQQHAVAATAADTHAADQLRQRAQHTARDARQWDQRATGLHTEQDLRGRLDPLLASVEDTARTIEHTRQRLARTAARDRHTDHARDIPPTLDHGPALDL